MTDDIDGDPPEYGGTTTDAPSVVKFTNRTDLGEILTDQSGRTLYVFTNDDENKSNCYEQCATNWPPLISSGKPRGPPEIQDDLGSFKRTEGLDHVTYRGWPLYYYAKDANVTDAKGDGVGGVWFVVRRPPTNSE